MESYLIVQNMLRTILLLTVLGHWTYTTAYMVHPGRHVCMQQKQVQTPVKSMQSYCKPVYKKHVYVCEGNKVCTTFRVVYQTAYREVIQMRTHSQMVYACCPGWTQYSSADNSCMKPLCKKECENGGTCTAPDHCSCPTGWSGDDCKEDLNECRSRSHGCQQTCTNTKGSYKCSCHEGFTLADDGKTCDMCLTCIPEYKNFVDGYQDLSNRVQKLEEEKTVLKNNIDKMQNDYQENLEKLRSDVQNMAAAPAQYSDPYESDHPPQNMVPWDRIVSLSEQISLLEERIGGCTCNNENNREGVPGL